jgi:hypothetical protein
MRESDRRPGTRGLQQWLPRIEKPQPLVAGAKVANRARSGEPIQAECSAGVNGARGLVYLFRGWLMGSSWPPPQTDKAAQEKAHVRADPKAESYRGCCCHCIPPVRGASHGELGHDRADVPSQL